MKSHIDRIEIIDIRLDFYHNKKKINSCQEMIDLNLDSIKSIFQMTIDKRSKSYDMFILKDVEYKSQICPLVFQNTNIRISQSCG